MFYLLLIERERGRERERKKRNGEGGLFSQGRHTLLGCAEPGF
jgi:hypothetical protein